MLAMMTYRPSQVIKAGKGTLGLGDRADVTVFDPQTEWTIDSNRFFSKSRNCPYDGQKVRGKVEHTIVGGEIRYSAEK